jgi:Tol biopolymer transport system component
VAVSWPPDDQHIAFVAYKNSQADLFVAQSDGTCVQRLTYLGANIGTVIWMDQHVIAFVSDWEGQDMLYLIDSDGGNLRRAR